jgi:hypothetical protein
LSSTQQGQQQQQQQQQQQESKSKQPPIIPTASAPSMIIIPTQTTTTTTTLSMLIWHMCILPQIHIVLLMAYICGRRNEVNHTRYRDLATTEVVANLSWKLFPAQSQQTNSRSAQHSPGVPVVEEEEQGGGGGSSTANRTIAVLTNFAGVHGKRGRQANHKYLHTLLTTKIAVVVQRDDH